jgi:hypothetical protein
MTTQNHLLTLSVDELQGYFSDFHKDFYGFRPRHLISDSQWRNRDYLIAQINQIHDVMDSMKETFSGREELRQNGWVIEETDPELAHQAKWLAQERDREYAEWVADIDAKAYGQAIS